MTRLSLRIRTPSRLHFGLLGWDPRASRQFGGVGLMIDSPGIVLEAEPAPEWRVEGPLARRVEQIIVGLRARLNEAGVPVPPVRIRVESAPVEHVGLGVGTQLSLAVARAVLSLAGTPNVTVADLARLTGRGGRSGIGLHGFHSGGLIVDGGRKTENQLPPLLVRAAFPADWSILIVQPRGVRGLHGTDESRAFADLPPIAQSETGSLCRLVLLEMLPAVLECDLAAFGAAIEELQSRVGAAFAPAQGGIYAAPQAAAIVQELKSLGFAGAGQSSWGPSLYAFTDRLAGETDLAVERLLRFGLDPSSVFWTKAANQGASLMVDG
jgi:beta-ribofuranosylaminobenzene 5'-phosphate synthase